MGLRTGEAGWLPHGFHERCSFRQIEFSGAAVDWHDAAPTICTNKEGRPMRYMCLVHFDASILTDAKFDRQDLDRRSLAYDEALRGSGHYVTSAAVDSGDGAVLVSVRDGKMSATDGPFVETKEQMGGFVLLEARDMNEAVRLAAGIPIALLGTIEIRPVLEIPIPPPVSG
jgi:hypothetical protein